MPVVVLEIELPDVLTEISNDRSIPQLPVRPSELVNRKPPFYVPVAEIVLPSNVKSASNTMFGSPSTVTAVCCTVNTHALMVHVMRALNEPVKVSQAFHGQKGPSTPEPPMTPTPSYSAKTWTKNTPPGPASSNFRSKE